ncbi:hypothetical protein L9F63_000903, partial [Diploptera punctata]
PSKFTIKVMSIMHQLCHIIAIGGRYPTCRINVILMFTQPTYILFELVICYFLSVLAIYYNDFLF